ncbi:hypothetical protein LA080_008058 [Diaporthe eres]|nr:hypothetical protein LA080_008058 [Diaporthe eres]
MVHVPDQPAEYPATANLTVWLLADMARRAIRIATLAGAGQESGEPFKYGNKVFVEWLVVALNEETPLPYEQRLSQLQNDWEESLEPDLAANGGNDAEQGKSNHEGSNFTIAKPSSSLKKEERTEIRFKQQYPEQKIALSLLVKKCTNLTRLLFQSRFSIWSRITSILRNQCTCTATAQLPPPAHHYQLNQNKK